MRSITADANYMRRRRENLGKKGFCSTCFLEPAIESRKSCLKCLEFDRRRTRRRTLATRIRTLTYYGKSGKLLCCARGCRVSDIQMLTLDHINNNGKQERESTGKLGWMFYEWLRSKGFPSGYQTLCANHQIKKEFERRRKAWL